MGKPQDNRENILIKKGLRRIEEICMDEDPMEKNKAISEIYKIAHTLASPNCRKNHPQWTEEIEKLDEPKESNNSGE